MKQPLLVSDLMTTEVYSIQPGEDLAKLQELMDEIHVRHVPVVDRQHTVVGLVSQRDLIRHVLSVRDDLTAWETAQMMENRIVRTIMVADVETVAPDTEVSEAGQVMLDNKLGCLPVVQGGRLVGIITEADFVWHVVGLATSV